MLPHPKHHLSRPERAEVLCGFQAEGSLGRRLVVGARQVRLLGDEVEVRAGIHTLGGFSAHADQQALLDWAAAFTRPPQQTFVVHGEPHASLALATLLHERLHFSVQLPQPGQVFEF